MIFVFQSLVRKNGNVLAPSVRLLTDFACHRQETADWAVRGFGIKPHLKLNHSEFIQRDLLKTEQNACQMLRHEKACHGIRMFKG